MRHENDRNSIFLRNLPKKIEVEGSVSLFLKRNDCRIWEEGSRKEIFSVSRNQWNEGIVKLLDWHLTMKEDCKFNISL